MKKKSSHKKNKSAKLLIDTQVERWYKNVSRGSKKTADVYLRRLRGFCEDVEKTPSELTTMDEDALFDMILDFVTEREKHNMGSYIRSFLNAVGSWLEFNRIEVRRKIKIQGANLTPTLDDERVPTYNELKKILFHANPREKVCCALMAHSGVRQGVIGDGNDGLRIKDFPELKINGDEVIFETVPTIIKVRANLSKTGKAYMTFLSEQGCEYLTEYLEGRIRGGEILGPDSDIVSPKYSNKKFLSTVKVRESIRKALRRAGVNSRPYVLRAYFNTQLQIAESQGKMTASYRQLFFGHTGTMEAIYSTRKGRLTEEMIEDMREKYRQSQVFLQTTKPEKDEKAQAVDFRRFLLRESGKSEEEIMDIDIDNMPSEEIWEMLNEKLGGKKEAPSQKQKIVTRDEAEELIEQGWEYISDWKDNKVILKAP